MSIVYADPSALARAYFADEAEHDELSRLLAAPDLALVTSELSRLELASAVRAAERARRLSGADAVLRRIELDLGRRLVTLALSAGSVLPRARELILAHRLRTLDALHLATALVLAPGLADDGVVVLLTRDDDQAAAARELGLTVI